MLKYIIFLEHIHHYRVHYKTTDSWLRILTFENNSRTKVRRCNFSDRTHTGQKYVFLKRPYAEQMTLELKGFLEKSEVGKGRRHVFTEDAE